MLNSLNKSIVLMILCVLIKRFNRFSQRISNNLGLPLDHWLSVLPISWALIITSLTEVHDLLSSLAISEVVFPPVCHCTMSSFVESDKKFFILTQIWQCTRPHYNIKQDYTSGTCLVSFESPRDSLCRPWGHVIDNSMTSRFKASERTEVTADLIPARVSTSESRYFVAHDCTLIQVKVCVISYSSA